MTEGTGTPTVGSKVTWLTQEAFDRLQAELEHLSGPARTEATARIPAAGAEGELKENGGYPAAKDVGGEIDAPRPHSTQQPGAGEGGPPPARPPGGVGARMS